MGPNQADVGSQVGEGFHTLICLPLPMNPSAAAVQVEEKASGVSDQFE
jgi:hypothetical protein